MSPADIVALVAGVRAELDRHVNLERRAHTAGYFPTSMEILGVAVPDLRRAVQPAVRELKGAPVAAVLATARGLIDTGTHEGRQAAYELIAKRADVLGELGIRDLEELGEGNDNWASVDAFATLVAGPVWRLGGVSDASVLGWTRSDDRWWRRTALAATVALNLPSRGGIGDVARTMMACDALASDHDPMVSKGLSWALRSVIRHDRLAVEGFLERHAGSVPPPVVREVKNKLKTGLKNPGGGGGDS